MPRLKPQLSAPPPPPPSLPPVPLGDKAALTAPEAADILSLGQTTVRQLIATGRLKVVRIGRALIIPRTEIDQFLAREPSGQALAPMDVKLLRALADARQDTAVAQRHAANLTERIAASKAERGASASRAGWSDTTEGIRRGPLFRVIWRHQIAPGIARRFSTWFQPIGEFTA